MNTIVFKKIRNSIKILVLQHVAQQPLTAKIAKCTIYLQTAQGNGTMSPF